MDFLCLYFKTRKTLKVTFIVSDTAAELKGCAAYGKVKAFMYELLRRHSKGNISYFMAVYGYF